MSNQQRSGMELDLISWPNQCEWQHGWQYFASSSLEHHFRETVVPSHLPRTSLICVPTRDMGLKQSASVVLGWTGAGATGQHALGQGGYTGSGVQGEQR